MFTPEAQKKYASIPPITAIAASIDTAISDNCNFATETTWSRAERGKYLSLLSLENPGRQYIHDATDFEIAGSRSTMVKWDAVGAPNDPRKLS